MARKLESTVEARTRANELANRGREKFTKGFTGSIVCDCARKKTLIHDRRFTRKITQHIKCKCSVVKSSRSRGIRVKADVVVINENTDFGFKNSNLA